MTDAILVSIITAIPPTVVATLAFISTMRNGRRLEATNKVIDSTHTIVNNQRTEMLKRIATLTRLIARLQPHDEEAKLVADEAHKVASAAALKEHVVAQRKADLEQ